MQTSHSRITKWAMPDTDLPAPTLRQAGGFTADEIKLVEESAR
jgi:hypothetical protein